MSRKKPVEATPEPTAAACLLVFGIPRGGRVPVGARFALGEAVVARWIAKHCGLSVVTAAAPPALSLAALLPEWQLRANGSPGLPVITGTLWENLRALAAEQAGQPAEPKPTASEGTAEATAERLALAEPLWAALAVGDTVLAPEMGDNGAIEGWWPATILAFAEEVFTLCWQDDPDYGFRKRRRTELALLRPGR